MIRRSIFCTLPTSSTRSMDSVSGCLCPKDDCAKTNEKWHSFLLVPLCSWADAGRTPTVSCSSHRPLRSLGVNSDYEE